MNSKIWRNKRNRMNGEIQINEKKMDGMKLEFFSNDINPKIWRNVVNGEIQINEKKMDRIEIKFFFFQIGKIQKYGEIGKNGVI